MNKSLLITGGAGFIGSNIADRFLKKGVSVTIFDNLVRYGTKENISWLKKRYSRLKVIVGDIRNYQQVKKAVKGKSVVIHLAAQVAVTTSVSDPRTDFEINALGTFNLLESIRNSKQKSILIFSSTNKVYGGMENIKIIKKKTRYAYSDLHFGISEDQPLDFHSPYGCSKGSADQYVRDYSRIYGIPTVVFRQSCIYGPRQFGIEDQGWIAWFIIAASFGKTINVYGDGRQVRDVLYVDDLVDLFDTAINKINIAKGKIYNVGGGINNTLSIWHEFKPLLENLFQKKIKVSYLDWRPGDQKVYISDIRLVERELGWKPKINVESGINKLFHWIQENKSLFNGLFR